MADTTTATPKGGFWNWFAKIAVLAGLGWLGRGIPGPILANAGARMRNGWLHTRAATQAANRWVRRQMMRLALLTLFVGSVSGVLIFVGLASESRAFVAVGGLIATAYLIFIWILLKGSVKVATGAIEKSTDILGSSVGSVLRKVGLAESDGESLKVRFGDIDAILAKGFVVLPGVAEAFFLLALMPSFATLVLMAIVAIGVIASGLISAHVGDTMVNGWRLVKRVNFALFIGLALIAVVAFFLPATFGAYANPGALDAWLANPTFPKWSFGFWGTVIGIGAIGAVAWTLAGLVKGEIGKRLTVAIMLATVIAMAVGGYRAWGSFDEDTAPHGEVLASEPEITYLSSPPHALGSVVGMKMPRVSYKADPSSGSSARQKVVRPTAPQPEPVVTVPKVAIRERGDGLDSVRQNNAEIEALLGL